MGLAAEVLLGLVVEGGGKQPAPSLWPVPIIGTPTVRFRAGLPAKQGLLGPWLVWLSLAVRVFQGAVQEGTPCLGLFMAG